MTFRCEGLGLGRFDGTFLIEINIEETATEKSPSACPLKDLKDWGTNQGVASKGQSIILRHRDVIIRLMTILIRLNERKAYMSILSQGIRNTSAYQAIGSVRRQHYKRSFLFRADTNKSVTGVPHN